MLPSTEYARSISRKARSASKDLAASSGARRNDWLKRFSQILIEQTPGILEANSTDVDRAREANLSPALLDRLALTRDRIAKLSTSLLEIATLTDPVGEVIEGSVRPNGLSVQRVRVPLGVVFFIYEARPGVTVDAASICVKSGNAVILRGGSEAQRSNQALASLIRDSLIQANLPPDSVQVVENQDRALVGEFLQDSGGIDVAIPRGGRSLIERVTQEARMPVIKHFDGICHVYVEKSADPEMALKIILNGKCQRPGVCNATESVLVHKEIAESFLPKLGNALKENGVEIRGCADSMRLIPGIKQATNEDYRTEYLDLILSLKVVQGIEEAIAHIEDFGSKHTDSIVTNDLQAADKFLKRVDSSAVLVNCSTRFNDGGELGLGAEIGISTDKFHARGPCGLRELMSYKYIVRGTGQVRE